MTFGRPVMVHEAYTTPLPSMIDDEYLRTDGEGSQPTNVSSRMGLCVQSCRLFEILADILSSFYTPKVRTGPQADFNEQQMVSQVMSFSNRLDSFVESIPHYLKPASSPDMPAQPEHLTLQQQVLYCRYSSCSILSRSFTDYLRFLYTRLLSLRPLLLMATRKAARDTLYPSREENLASLDDHLVQRCCFLCVETAHRLIETIHVHLDTTYRSSGWHSVYCMFQPCGLL